MIYCRKSLLKRCPAKLWKQAPPHQPQRSRDTGVWLHPKRATYRKLQSVKAATQASLSKSVGVGLSKCVQRWDPCPHPLGLVAELPGKGTYFQALRLNAVCTVGFGPCLGLVTFFFPISLCLCQSRHCILKTHDLFDFTGSQLERNFASE